VAAQAVRRQRARVALAHEDEHLALRHLADERDVAVDRDGVAEAVLVGLAEDLLLLGPRRAGPREHVGGPASGHVAGPGQRAVTVDRGGPAELVAHGAVLCDELLLLGPRGARADENVRSPLIGNATDGCLEGADDGRIARERDGATEPVVGRAVARDELLLLRP